jgi:transcriptional regulator with XRE-family HTH domain
MMLGEQLKAARLAAGLSQQQVAEKVGVSRSTVSRYERGLAVPDGRTLSALARALHVGVDRLLEPRGDIELVRVPCYRRW